MALKELDFNVTIGEITAHFEGLLGGELGDVIMQIINAMAVDVYNAVWKIVHDILVSSLLKFINVQLEVWIRTLQFLFFNLISISNNNHFIQGVKFADIIGGIIKPPSGGGGGGCVTSTTSAAAYMNQESA
jgi:hypothetical protein